MTKTREHVIKNTKRVYHEGSPALVKLCLFKSETYIKSESIFEKM